MIYCDMDERETGFAMNQEDLFDAIKQAAQHHYLGKAFSSTQRFKTPLQTTPGKCMFERLIERLHQATQTFCDRSSHHWSNNWMKRVHECVRLLFDRFLDGAFDRRPQCL